mgnify:CR=1 FL=1
MILGAMNPNTKHFTVLRPSEANMDIALIPNAIDLFSSFILRTILIFGMSNVKTTVVNVSIFVVSRPQCGKCESIDITVVYAS